MNPNSQKSAKGRRRRQRHGFSLIELLVVIAILMILAMITLPVIKMLGEKRQEVACADNLRKLGFATSLYITDHNGILETFQGGNVSQNMWSTELLRGGYIDPTLPTGTSQELMTTFINSSMARLFRCPMGKVPPSYNLPANWGLWLWATYGMAMYAPEGAIGKSALDPTGQTKSYKVRVSNVSFPGKFILLADSANNATECYQTFRIYSSSAGGFALRHRNRANAVFLDGHLESLTRDDLVRLGVSAGMIYKADR